MTRKKMADDQINAFFERESASLMQGYFLFLKNSCGDAAAYFKKLSEILQGSKKQILEIEEKLAYTE